MTIAPAALRASGSSSFYLGSARKALFERLDEAIGAIPGVDAASLSQIPLLAGGSSQTWAGFVGEKQP
jgi:hypothetical protein